MFELMDLVTVGALLFLLLLMVLPKKVHYAMSGVILIVLGVLPFLVVGGIEVIDVSEYPITRFVLYFIIVIAGKDLFKEGFEEDSKNILKYPSMILGIGLIVFSSIPTLYKFQVIPWTLPIYDPLIDSILYIVSGIFLLIGIFTLLKD